MVRLGILFLVLCAGQVAAVEMLVRHQTDIMGSNITSYSNFYLSTIVLCFAGGFAFISIGFFRWLVRRSR